MAKFVIVLKGMQNIPDRRQTLRHVEYLKALHDAGNLVLCGQLHEACGAMQILSCASKAEAEAIILRDPFISEGVFGAVTVDTLIEANAENNWLIKPE